MAPAPQNKSGGGERIGEIGSMGPLGEPLLTGTQWTESRPLSLEIWKPAETASDAALMAGLRQVSSAY